MQYYHQGAISQSVRFEGIVVGQQIIQHGAGERVLLHLMHMGHRVVNCNAG